MLEMKLRRHDAPSYRTAVIAFPAAEPDLQKAMDEIGNFTDYGYIAYLGCTPAVEELLHQSESTVMEMRGMRL